MTIKILIAVLVVIAVVIVLLYRKNASGETRRSFGGPAPSAQDSLKQELTNRMEEFLDRDLFLLVIQPVVDFRIVSLKSYLL